MPREKVLEAQIGHKMSRRGGKTVVIVLPVACQHQWLRLVLPLQAFDIEAPQVPFCARDIRRVCVQILHRQRRDFRRSYFQRAKIPFRHGYLCGIHGLHDQFAKGILRGRKGRSRQESGEFSEHHFQ